MTSLAAMLALVPAPPWMTSTANWPWCSLDAISASHARTIARSTRDGRRPRAPFAVAHARFTRARATMSSGKSFIWTPLIW